MRGAAKLSVLDLFSGIGGFSLGLERTGGYRPIGFCEINEYCRRVLAKHWPGVPCHDDVTTRQFTRGEADVICGGFPCQDVSYAGPGAGLAGERSGLYRELVRAIRLVRPLYAILENVAALLTRGLGTVLGDLAEIGYDAEWHCIPASAVGAPHERDRIWIVAHPAGIGRGAWCPRRLSSGAARQQIEQLAPPADTAPLLGTAFFREQSDRALQRYWPEAWGVKLETLRGVDDGVSGRLDGLAALGNTVVPAIPEIIGRAILASLDQRPSS